MKVFRKRWWGIYVIAPWVFIGLLVSFAVMMIKIGDHNYQSAFSAIFCGLVLFLLFMILYAPYTFHNAMRVMCFVVFILYIWYFLDCASKGNWSPVIWSGSSALRALVGLLVIGTTALLISVRCKKPKRNPYRRDGSLRKPLLREIRDLGSNDDGNFA